MLRLLAALCLLGCAAPARRGPASPPAGDAQTVAELGRITQELLDAIAPGDRSAWERRLAPGFVYTDETGRAMNRDEFLAELTPLPPGYQGSLLAVDVVVHRHGDAAVVTHRDVEKMSIHGNPLSSEFRSTSTFVREDGRWLLAAVHVTVTLGERTPARVDAAGLAAFAGRYELAPGVAYVVTQEGGKLIGRREGRPTQELLPLCDTIFYPAGTARGEKVFVKDERGRVVRMLDRRENRDLVWTRVD